MYKRQQFRIEFSAFCKNNGIKHELSSPYNPESNRLAEAAVKNIKTLITRCHRLDENLQLAIAAWRNMARADGVSPSQLFFGRIQRQQLPLTAEQTKTQESSTAGRDATAGKSERYKNTHTSDYSDLHFNQQAVSYTHLTLPTIYPV